MANTDIIQRKKVSWVIHRFLLGLHSADQNNKNDSNLPLYIGPDSLLSLFFDHWLLEQWTSLYRSLSDYCLIQYTRKVYIYVLSEGAMFSAH